jgi:hypothetical protein
MSAKQFMQIFGNDVDDNSNDEILSDLHQKLWSTDPTTCLLLFPYNRCICWRLYFGLLSHVKSSWVQELKTSTTKYISVKNDIFPSFSQNGFDPLSDDTDTLLYFENIEIKKSIELDLNRLYMTGVDEDYFQTKSRTTVLLNVLFIWSVQNPITSYRQGMHEISATILYCLEKEQEAHSESEESFLKDSFTGKNIEANTYWIFSSIMEDLDLLFDPTLIPKTAINSSNNSRHNTAKKGAENVLNRSNGKNGGENFQRGNLGGGQPRVVKYLTEFQDLYLPCFDPELSAHLVNAEIHSQFYGLRWTRLLLGREFKLCDTHILRIWDCLFSSKNHEKNQEIKNEKSVKSHFLGSEISDDNFSEKKDYCSLLVALRDFMIAMLIYIRSDLLNGDASATLGYLMKFPVREGLIESINVFLCIRICLIESINVFLCIRICVYILLISVCVSIYSYDANINTHKYTHHRK